MRTILAAICVMLSPAAFLPAVAAIASPAAAADEFPEDWFWRIGPSGTRHREMTGKPAPKLAVKGWVGEKDEVAPLKKGDVLGALKGKVVVVDFWATWCGPCRAALPENAAMMKELGSKGLAFVGVHDAARGFETMEQVAKGAGVAYPLAIDDGGKSTKAYAVGFWPTYAVIDRKGTLRAIGLQPGHVREVVEKLLAEPAPASGDGGAAAGDDAKPAKKPNLAKPAAPAADGDAPAPGTMRVMPLAKGLLEGDARRRAQLAPFDLCPQAPELTFATQWTNTAPLGEARAMSDLRGKIVVLDFWATWCGPCLASIPHMNELARKYADRGVVFIGVCRPDGAEKMRGIVDSKKIEYPLCVDSKGAINTAYLVDSFPDYYVIDRTGRLRGADVQSTSLEQAIVHLLDEK